MYTCNNISLYYLNLLPHGETANFDSQTTCT